MPDDTRIAVEVCLPEKCATGDERVPALVEFTRYWRCCEDQPLKPRPVYFASLGFAHALVDCRGTGASFGIRQSEQSVEEARDFSFVINWLSEHEWCNGSVVTIGVSYSANTAELAVVDSPPALKASIPRFSDFDTYAHLFFPGGLKNKAFIDPWGAGIQSLDLNNVDKHIHSQWKEYCFGSVKPVDTDRDKTKLYQAVNQHKNNRSLMDYLSGVEYRDDFNFASALHQEGDRWLSPHLIQHNSRIRELPSYHCASFNDAGTAAGAIARFLQSTAPMRVVIGYWSHGGMLDTNPLIEESRIAEPHYEAHFDDIAYYLEGLRSHKCNDEDSLARLNERAIYYYTAGLNRWRKTDQWPPEGINEQCWYFGDAFLLTETPPVSEDASDKYKVDFDIGTGEQSCWNQMVPEVQYGDRAAIDRRLLCYTSSPLESSVEITGTPVVSLYMASIQPDGAVIAYLEMVAPDGRVTILTEGCFRLIHRKESYETPPYPIFGPHHTYNRKDALPMPINQCERVRFELLPLSVRIEPKHSIRIAIAGHDKDTFDSVVPGGEQHYTIYRNAQAMSCLYLPMREIGENDSSLVFDNPFLASSRVNNTLNV
ncbi:CocE/NonD family hydrolase [SAR92 clade bacterium H246]